MNATESASSGARRSDGAALDDRFAEGWQTSDVAATDPGAADGAAAGLHALVDGSLVALDGQRAPRVPGKGRKMTSIPSF